MTNGSGCSGFYHFVEYLIVLSITECFCDLQQHDNDSESSSSKVKEIDFLASLLGDSDPGILIFSGLIFCACACVCVRLVVESCPFPLT